MEGLECGKRGRYEKDKFVFAYRMFCFSKFF